MKSMVSFNFDIINLIQDFAGISEMWKTRFSNDVVPKINQNIQTVGLINGKKCARCYTIKSFVRGSSGYCAFCEYGNVQKYVEITFDEFSKEIIKNWSGEDKIFCLLGFDNYKEIQKNTYIRYIHLGTIRGDFKREYDSDGECDSQGEYDF